MINIHQENETKEICLILLLHWLEEFNRCAYYLGMLSIILKRLLRDEQLKNSEAPEQFYKIMCNLDSLVQQKDLGAWFLLVFKEFSGHKCP